MKTPKRNLTSVLERDDRAGAIGQEGYEQALGKPQAIALEEWHQRALSGLNDRTAPLPRVW